MNTNITSVGSAHEASGPTLRHSMGRRRFLQGATAAAFMPGLLAACTEPPACSDAGGAVPRTLVCIFLSGGADTFNMFLPNDLDRAGSDWGTYTSTRGIIAPDRSSILPVGNGDYAFHGGLPQLRSLYQQGQVAVVGNVGPLARPTTPADFAADNGLPQLLFAHDAQEQLWQTAARTVGGANIGWGAKIAEQISGCDPAASIPAAISAQGSNLWQTSSSQPYIKLHPTRSLSRLGGYDPAVRDWISSTDSLVSAMDSVLSEAEGSGHDLVAQVGAGLPCSIDTTAALEDLTSNTPANEVAMGDYGQNRLAAQLHLVARLIKAREALGQSRQVFFVRMGGWDTHSDQNLRLPPLLAQLDEAIGQFQYALGPDGLDVAESVTTFTASDFGRTLTSNGDGTDHGWGGHSFVIGGDVRGGRLYGQLPSFSDTNNPDDVGESSGFAGRIIPKISVTQLGATLALWSGVPHSGLASIFPDLDNFPLYDLNFFNDPDT